MDAAATNLTAQCRRVIGSHLEGEVTQMVQLVIGRYDGVYVGDECVVHGGDVIAPPLVAIGESENVSVAEVSV